MPLDVTQVSFTEGFETCKALRYQVMIVENGFDPDLDVDADDFKATTRHFLGRDVDTNEFVAVARCCVDATRREGKIGRVAVLAKCQGRGYGAALMQAVEENVKNDCDRLLLGAVMYKVGFYRRLGYERVDETTFFDETEQCWMAKSISHH
ncbi:hypothetical protein Poli38472_005853 [Pythium oligandrum]|uniref:N-acetyltransferase domain-containing protein n=1 Tax=Pythium oligandrum TaxID=41045 RepID=A0A8K1FLL7_PYTOL|nr:hypothetical protein Poli38472_005853 [Pythium oligandrum]|eukprot:TMW68385.1 hypothetical protein Poli38472_005853 [Pythium oligandrum]